MRMEPCNGRIIARQVKREQVTGSGILIPTLETAKGKSLAKNVIMEVLQVGPGERHPSDGQRRPITEVKPGDFVLIDVRVCEPLYADGEMLYALDEGNIIARVHDLQSRIVIPQMAVAQ